MSIFDPIADLLTRIRNACKAEHHHVQIRWSKLKEAIVKILVEEGFVSSYRLQKDGEKADLVIILKYSANRQPVVRGIRRMSKPGKRTYVTQGEIPRVLRGMGIAVLSTSQGVMSGNEARKRGIGGELLCKVW